MFAENDKKVHPDIEQVREEVRLHLGTPGENWIRKVRAQETELDAMLKDVMKERRRITKKLNAVGETGEVDFSSMYIRLNHLHRTHWDYIIRKAVCDRSTDVLDMDCLPSDAETESESDAEEESDEDSSVDNDGKYAWSESDDMLDESEEDESDDASIDGNGLHKIFF